MKKLIILIGLIVLINNKIVLKLEKQANVDDEVVKKSAKDSRMLVE